MTRDDLRNVLYDFLDRLEVEVGEVDDLTEEFLSELEDNGYLESDDFPE